MRFLKDCKSMDRPIQPHSGNSNSLGAAGFLSDSSTYGLPQQEAPNMDFQWHNVRGAASGSLFAECHGGYVTLNGANYFVSSEEV